MHPGRKSTMTLGRLFNISEHQNCHEMRIVGTWREPDEESFFPTHLAVNILIYLKPQLPYEKERPS